MRVLCQAGLCAMLAGLAACASGPHSRKQSLYPASVAPDSSASSTQLYTTTTVVEAPTARSTRGSGASAPAPRAGGDGAGTLAMGLDSHNQVVTTGDFRDKVVVLDFWATWCGPCKASAPAFQQLTDRFANDPRVMTLAVHTDSTGDPKAYMREHRYTFPMIPRGHEFAAAYDVNVLPTFIVLDQRGRIIYRDTGLMGDTQRQEIERLVRGALR